MIYPIIQTIVEKWHEVQKNLKEHPRQSEILDLLDLAADALRLARDIEHSSPREEKTWRELQELNTVLNAARIKREWEATEKAMLAEMDAINEKD